MQTPCQLVSVSGSEGIPESRVLENGVVFSTLKTELWWLIAVSAMIQQRIRCEVFTVGAFGQRPPAGLPAGHRRN